MPVTLRLPGIALAVALTAACQLSSPEKEGGMAHVPPGVYERLDTLQNVETNQAGSNGSFFTQGLRRTRLQIRSNGTYLHQEFFTAPDSSVVDFRFMQERGSIRQEDSLLVLSGIWRFNLQPMIGSMGSWTFYSSDSYRLLKVEAQGFSTRLSYEDEEIWTRIQVPDLQADSGKPGVYHDPAAGYSIRLPEAWHKMVRSEINWTTYDFSCSESIPGGRDGTASLRALTTDKAPGETLELRMDDEIQAVRDWYTTPLTVLSRKTSLRGGRAVAEAVVRVSHPTSSLIVYREKIVLFEGNHGAFTRIHYNDRDTLYDANTVFPAIDSSLTFF